MARAKVALMKPPPTRRSPERTIQGFGVAVKLPALNDYESGGAAEVNRTLDPVLTKDVLYH